ncbi:transporter substrate-binding domain-containing protein [Bradyrhizobium brasilense]|uniref:transporter substrate-binding domain-containing protein n=1 Tax=Bradyrhizobium brasilense TaxID=1419277 RepID=UPI0014569EEE|nr:transporter substrate-binding domain-containing protein [Bradyrhizobium brasilense]NLS75274.1 transporter substrate-binding domain-containing protein [Bradyrhizobium brasilense]
MCGETVAVTRSSALPNLLVKAWSEENCVQAGKPAVVIVGSDNNNQGRMMVEQGRVDAFQTGLGSMAFLKRTVGDRYYQIGKPFGKTLYGFGFGKDNVELGEKLKKALSEVIADGTYVEPIKKWKLPVHDMSIEQPMINAVP